MKLLLSDIVVKKRHRRDLGDLAELARSIQTVGLLHPPVVTRDHVLIAGARRLAALKRLGWTTTPVTVVDLDQIILGERDENTVRLDFSPSEMVDLARALRPLEEKAAKARQQEHGKTAPGKKANTSGKLPEVSGGESRDRVAAAVGVSAKTLQKAEAVVQAAEADPARFGPLVAEMDKRGKVDKAYHQLRAVQQQEARQTQVWPTGQYGVILCDPPWQPETGTLDPTRQIENQYPTLSLPDLCNLADEVRRIALPDCVLVMWTTAQKIAEAVDVIRTWGFSIQSGAVWVKPSIGMGYWFRQRHELIVLATKGHPATPLAAARPDSVIEAPRRKHSQKPDLYTRLDTMFPDIPKVELFARDPARAGWATWGNEEPTGA